MTTLVQKNLLRWFVLFVKPTKLKRIHCNHQSVMRDVYFLLVGRRTRLPCSTQFHLLIAQPGTAAINSP